MIAAVVCVDKNNGIGKNGDLLIHNKDDMKRFKEITTGGSIICGRKTYESFPKRPLKNRTNIVVSRKATKHPKIQGDGSIRTQMRAIKLWLQKKDVIEENNGIYIIGGGQIYKELLPLCERIYMTKFDIECDADTFFPELTNEWEVTEDLLHIDDNGNEMRYQIYDRNDYKIKYVAKGIKDNDLIVSVETFNNFFTVILNTDDDQVHITSDWEYLDKNVNVKKFVEKTYTFVHSDEYKNLSIKDMWGMK